MRVFIVFICILSFITCSSSTAQSAVNAQGAQKLKSIFESLIEQQTAAQKLSGGSLKTTGNIMIEPAGNYYAVKLPALTLTDVSGNRAELGVIAINAIPGDNVGQWKMSVAWPSPISYVDKNGKIVTKISIGGQRMAGLFDERLEHFLKLDSEYKNIKIENLTNGYEVLLSNTKLQTKLDESSEGVFSGPFSGILSDIIVRHKKFGTIASLDKVSVEADLFEFSAAKNKELRQQIENFSERVQSQGIENASVADQAAFINMITQSIESLGNGFTSQYTLEGLKVTFPETDHPKAPNSMSMDQASFGLDMSGFSDSNVKLSLRMGYENLSVVPVPHEFTEFSPKTINIDLSLNDIPFKELLELLQNYMDTGVNNSSAAQMLQLQAAMALPKLFNAAGTNLTINKVEMISELSEATMSGKVSVDQDAPKGIKGFIDIAITGLDEIMKKAQESAIESNNSGQKTNLAKIFPALVLLKGTAIEEEGPDGRTVSKFKVTMNENGNIMINTTSIEALTGGR